MSESCISHHIGIVGSSVSNCVAHGLQQLFGVVVGMSELGETCNTAHVMNPMVSLGRTAEH